MKTVPIKALTVPPRPGKVFHDDWDELTDSLTHNGLRQPLVVNPHLQVIDGARRLKILTELGVTEVEVEIGSTIKELATIMEAQREELKLASWWRWSKMTPGRVYNLYRAMKPMQEAELSEFRSSLGIGVSPSKRGEIPSRARPAGEGFRFLMARATGNNDTWDQHILTMYSHALKPGAPADAKDIVKEMERGLVTPYGADKRYRDLISDEFKGDVRSSAAQIVLLEQANNSLTAIIKGFGKLGPLSDEFASSPELQEIMFTLRKNRAKLIRFVRLLEEKVK